MKKMLFLTLLMSLATNSQAVFFESDGMIVIEGENYSGLRNETAPPAWALTDNSLASGGKYMYFGDSATGNYNGGNWAAAVVNGAARLDYEIEVATGGTYYIWVRAFENPGNSFFVGVDGLVGTARPAGTGDWVWWGTNQGGGRSTITLTAGKHTLNVYRREDLCGLDKLILAVASEYTPSGNGPNESLTAGRGEAHTPVPTNKNNQVGIGTIASVSWYSPEQGTNGDPKDDPNIASVTGYDVRFGTNPDPNSLAPVFTLLQSLPVSLDPATTYYWRVDTHVKWTTGSPTVVKGQVWQFTTLAPALTFKNVITPLDLMPSTLSATVTGFKDPISSAVFELLTAGATLTDSTVDKQNPTATLTTATAGTYQVKLTVSDGTTTREKTAEVKVYADACAAKKAAPSGWTANYYDLDGNCLVNMNDFAVLAQNWLNNTEMKVQESYAKDVVVLELDIQVECENAYAPTDPDYTTQAPLEVNNGAPSIGFDSGAASGQLINGFGSANLLTYQVVVSQTGAYTLHFRAFHEWIRQVSFDLVTSVSPDGNPANDTLTNIVAITMNQTAGAKWYSYSAPVNLTAGTHLIRMTNSGAAIGQPWGFSPDFFGFKKN